MTQLGLDIPSPNGALFHPSGIYRFRLWRRWGVEPHAAFVMLNPSIADAEWNDRTVARCVQYAKLWGCGGLEVANIFAYRSTDPDALKLHPDPVGPGNDDAILAAVAGARVVVCGWGHHGALHGRGLEVYRMLVRAGVQPTTLKMTERGQPGHPLYLRRDRLPVPFTMEPA